MPYDFDTIAAGYDRMNHLMTFGMDRRWRRLAVRQLSASSAEFRIHNSELTVLDVACGTGDIAVELLKKGYSVTGVDLSKEMLALAHSKVASNPQLSTLNSQFLRANAEQLPFDDESFDAVICAFGVRNFVHLERGLAEMMRVLKPGGRMVIMELSTPDSCLLRPLYNIYTRHLIPWLGARVAGNREAYTYLPASIEKFPKGEAMLEKLEQAGFKAEQKKLFFGVCRLYKCVKSEE